jgi:hypothetical protein
MRRKIYKDQMYYQKNPNLRIKMAHYLKVGSFKQIGGDFIPGKRIRRNRMILFLIALFLTLIGLYSVFT